MNRNLLQIRSFLLQRIGRPMSTKAAEPIENQPIKFSTSPAAKRTVMPIVKRFKPNNIPWYQPYVVVGSVSVFMIYFCIFREESDVDLEFTRTLYSRVKGLEKEQLLQSYRFNKEHGKSVDDIEKRLKELELEESKATVG